MTNLFGTRSCRLEAPESHPGRLASRTIPYLLAVFGSALFFCSDTASPQASHLRNASDARLQKMLELRLRGFPSKFQHIAISPSPTPRKLPTAEVEVPQEVYSEIASSSAQSFLYWDGKAVKYDLSRPGIDNDLPVYGLSMSKSITSYLLGRAHCAGHIASLDDRIKKYVPSLDGTFYGDATIRNALNMASGDRKLYSETTARGGPGVWKDYVVPVAMRGVSVVDTMRKLGNREPAETAFAYRDANADAVAMVISAVAPGGLGEFASRTLARDAGFERPAMYLADRNNAALAFAYFYAARLDWLRAAIFIGEQFKAEGCIGDYLRSAISDSVPVTVTRAPWRRYGKFFWSGLRWSNRKHAAMLGHGGQTILVGLEEGRVLYFLSTRQDYDRDKVIDAVFE